MAEDLALRPDQLYRRTDPATLGFTTTSELPALVGAIGQPLTEARIGGCRR
jgi:hypothetical protein